MTTNYTTTRDTAVAATLAAIDEAVRPLCAQCGEPLPPDNPSRDFHAPDGERDCQRAWHEALAVDPRAVLDLPDGAAVVYEPGQFNHGGPVRPPTPLEHWAAGRFGAEIPEPIWQPCSTRSAQEAIDAAERLLDGVPAELARVQRDVLRSLYAIARPRRPVLSTLFRRLTGRDR